MIHAADIVLLLAPDRQRRKPMATPILERSKMPVALAVKNDRLVEEGNGHDIIAAEVRRPTGHIPTIAQKHDLLLGFSSRLGS